MHVGLTREQEIQLRLDRVEEWLMQVQKCNEGAREVKFY
jgi:hypothetical protein